MIYSHTPFQAEYTSKIFQHIVSSERYLKFGLKGSEDTISIIRGLLCPNPSFRLGNLSAGIKGIMDHSFFTDVDWQIMCRRQVPAPYVPVIKNVSDSSNFSIYDENNEIPLYSGSEDYFDTF
jgi:serine/threonine protein kinase